MKTHDIRFCGLVPDSGDWVFGSYIDQGSKSEAVIMDDFGTISRVDRETVRQYTGLSDDQGNKIYFDLGLIGDVALEGLGFLGSRIGSALNDAAILVERDTGGAVICCIPAGKVGPK